MLPASIGAENVVGSAFPVTTSQLYVLMVIQTILRPALVTTLAVRETTHVVFAVEIVAGIVR
jgi:hypothetical protein